MRTIEHGQVFSSKEELIKAIPEGFKVVAVPIEKGMRIYGDPKFAGSSRGIDEIDSLFRGARLCNKCEVFVLPN